MTSTNKVFGLLESPQIQRWKKASAVKKLKTISDFPRLEVWNYDACEEHEVPTPTCSSRKCGGELYMHQKKTAVYSYMGKHTIVASSTGVGKQQPVSEPVLTPTGWKPIGSLNPGDLVIGSNGMATEVLGVFPQTERRVYKLTFNDHSYTYAGPDHLWLAGDKASIHQGRGRRVVTTEYLKNTLHRQWSIPQVAPVEFAPANLPCDPYTIGVVLGDGSMDPYGGASVTTDLTILEKIDVSYVRPHKTCNYVGVGFIHASTLNKVLPYSRSWEKEVPAEYMLGSSADRLALLQGLLDTDGSPIRTGGVEFSTTSERLALQVSELAQSLGGTGRISAPRITRYTHLGEQREGRVSWRVNVKLPSGMEPFRLQRKLDRWVPPTKYPVRRVLRSVERVEDQDSVCISVAAEDNLYITRDYIVTHNTSSALATLALVHHYGEEVRCVAIVPSTAVLQWEAEIKRWTPGFTVEKIPPKTHKKVRLETYAKPWNILVIGYHAFSKDFANVVKCGAKQSIVDDVDPILDHRNATHNAIVSLTRTCNLNIVMNATISSMRAEQVYSATNLIGGSSIWGSMTNFTRNYIKKDKVWVTNRKGEKIRTFQTVGYKNLKDMMSKLRPMLIRYSYEDIADDLNIPDVVPQEVMLEMSPAQKRKMQELQSGVRTVLNNKGMPTAQKSINALTLYAYANQITSGIFALKTSDGGFEPDSAQASPKADWLMNKLTGEWKNEKVIVYVKYKGSHLALSERFKKAGIGYSIISGAITDPQERQAEIDRFWNDPDTKVILISRSGERSLNLQNARITVVYDQIVNPGVFTQVAGRSRRVGSNHGSVFLISLIMEDTHEERIPLALASRQAFQDYVYDEAQDQDDNGTYLFQKLTPDQLLKLLAP